MFERVSINCKEGDTLPQSMPFMNVENCHAPQLKAWAVKYNSGIASLNAFVNSERAKDVSTVQDKLIGMGQSMTDQEQEQAAEPEHVGAGNYNPFTKTWDTADIESETNTEESYPGAGEYDPFTKTWK